MLRSRLSRLARIAVIAFCASPCLAEVKLAPLFVDGAVLQRDMAVPVWGTAEVGEKVTVTFADQTLQTIADDQGLWRVHLDPLTASAQSRVLTVTGKDATTPLQVQNVLVGEVWFCSGQSNMEWVVQRSMNAAEELAAAEYPHIRHFRVSRAASDKPLPMRSAGTWTPARAGTDHAGDKPTSVRVFSAVAYFFARDLHRELGVPVGVINSSYGGTMIEAWMPRETMQATPHWPAILERHEARVSEYPGRVERHQQQLQAYETALAEAKAAGTKPPAKPRAPEGPLGRQMPSSLYNGMVTPVLPYAVRGVLWYQGESNASRHDEYPALIKGLIQRWRQDFERDDLPFYFVQIANFRVHADKTARQWAFQREAQLAALDLPHTGVAVTIDVGDPGNVHPANKQAVGHRLALLALSRIYGKDVQAQGPTFKDATFENGQVILAFEHARGLELREVKVDDRHVDAFELAGADRVFHSANAKVEGERVVVSSPEVPQPVAVRYAWHNTPAAPLYNGAGMPALPFRSDDWKAE